MWLRALAALVLISSVTAAGQAPRPLPPPRPGTPTTPSTPPAKPANPAGNIPTEATLGVPIYPNSQFLVSYDAGQRQRFYLFGSQASFTELVAYYRTVLKERGDLLFEQPPTHTFEIGRFREETMAFPPSVTIKDYKFGGSEGYLNPKPGATPPRFPTIIQFVPPPPGATK
ncbi:MAG TPA: hypothetical protein VH702_04910 [Vicinamibacterales bacterium]|jgi:hypothetical protein